MFIYLYKLEKERLLTAALLLLHMTPERINRIEKVLANRQNDITVVLENVFDPHNISAIMRSCDAVGIQEMFVLTTKIPMHKNWGFRSSRSANKWITVHQYTNTQTCVEDVRKKYTTILTTNLTSDATNLYNLDLTGNIALVFGNEQTGLTKEMIAAADGNFIIPQVGMIQSLNISVACAVTLYEAYRQKQAAGHYKGQKLGAEEYQQLYKQWTQPPTATF